MMIFKLTPIDAESDHWKASTYKGEVIARAEDEQQARTLANMHFGLVRKQVRDAYTPTAPWRLPELVTCETVDDWEGETDGRVELLYPPVNNAVVDLRHEAEYLRVLAYQAVRCTDDVRPLGGMIHRHLLGQASSTAAIELADVGGRIIDWADEVKETGDPDRLPLIATGLRKIADELERQATWPS